MADTKHQDTLDLDEAGVRLLQQIVADRAISAITVDHNWSDDHIAGVSVRLEAHGKAYLLDLWWCGTEIAGACQYWDSPKAQADLYLYFRDTLEARRNEWAEGEAWSEDYQPLVAV